MATYRSALVDMRSIPSAYGAGVEMVVRGFIKFPTAVTLATNDVLVLSKLPKGHAFVSMTIDNDALGTGAAVTGGILNIAETAVEFAAFTAQAAASASLINDIVSGARRFVPLEAVNRTVGLVMSTGGATAVAAGAVVGCTLRYRAKQSEEQT